MFRTTLLRATRPHIRPKRITRPNSTTTTATPQSRVDRINRRLPAFLHKHTRALGTAPLSHITSFLILHELTAIIPLFGLAAYFHYTHWLPSWFAEGAFVLSGVERFGRYFRRKGWIRSGEAEEAEREVAELQHEREAVKSLDISGGEEAKKLRKVDKAWNLSEGGVRLVVEFATAYAITKALLVPRIMFSVWATPGFARWTVVPAVRRFKGLFKKKSAVDVGVVPKSGSGKVPENRK
jgi:hypothetical protein